MPAPEQYLFGVIAPVSFAGLRLLITLRFVSNAPISSDKHAYHAGEASKIKNNKKHKSNQALL